jgi:hypothetical protein
MSGQGDRPEDLAGQHPFQTGGVALDLDAAAEDIGVLKGKDGDALAQEEPRTFVAVLDQPGRLGPQLAPPPRLDVLALSAHRQLAARSLSTPRAPRRLAPKSIYRYAKSHRRFGCGCAPPMSI